MRAVSLHHRGGFTLVELLVTISVIVVLVAMFGGAISAARNGAQANTTTNAIARLDQIISTQFRRYETRSVSRNIVNALRNQIPNPSAARAWHIRRNMITADMPDRWSDVALLASGSAGVQPSAAQLTYVATWNAFTNTQRTLPGSNERQHVNFKYGGAECLFMIVMQGGFADCLDCNDLAQLKKGDKDNDGALEFWDDWNNPIDYILWAPGFQRAGDTTAFFSSLDQAFPASGSVRPGLGMRPLVYSAGPDGEYAMERNGDAATLSRGSSPTGRDCGNPAEAETQKSGRATDEGKRADNIVNVELQAES